MEHQAKPAGHLWYTSLTQSNNLLLCQDVVMHAADASGYPVDPTTWALEDRLGELAAQWRAAAGDTASQARIVNEYHAAIDQLYALDWNGVLDFDAYLPIELMPTEYLQRCQRSVPLTSST